MVGWTNYKLFLKDVTSVLNIMFRIKIKENYLIYGYLLFFLVGLILHLVPALRFIPENITDLFLLTANLIVLVQVTRINARVGFLVFFLLAWMFTYFAEVLGVYTGHVFGAYHYGSAMKLQVLAVPLVIPFNWVMLVLGMLSIVRLTKLPVWAIPPLAAMGLVLFDYTLEPVAVILDYWTWEGGSIPLQNYLAWFIIALFVSSAAQILKFDLDKKLIRYYILIQWVFFLILNVFLRLGMPES
jgi:putative membrane protein